jgi:hypothetical protein
MMTEAKEWEEEGREGEGGGWVKRGGARDLEGHGSHGAWEKPKPKLILT